MTAVDELVAFVRQQLDADEALARRVAERYVVRNSDRPDDGQPYWPLPSIEATFRGRIDPDIVAGLDLIRTYDPARVLAEVEAKRRILDLHIGAHDCTEIHTGVYPDDWPADAGWGKAGERRAHAANEHFEADQPCPTVRLLAQPYAGRDGWREEWQA